MIYKHEAIYKLNPSVVAIRDDIAYDVEGNVVSYNNSAATTEGNITELRTERNAKLAETDWVVTMHKELGTNIPAAMKTYRQALRDITDSATSLDDVTWPEKP
ncbi:tail assembly chaperone [Methylophilales phage Melnitz EXVC044M]|nr:tail assembly chaperone [Methylophilales phage Melnitz-1 EXVC043M]QZI94684.1 tail assembly chaperone [Methylophilales phage Melnitz-2 EXVC040M]QZI94906.1 tail assembly chaperone [Methylophilales phage Melnitz EXVC044M]